MSAKSNAERSLSDLLKQRTEFEVSLKQEEELFKGNLVGSSVASILRISINKLTEKIELLEEVLNVEQSYNFITSFPSLRKSLNNIVMTEAEVLTELQRMKDTMSADDGIAQRLSQFMDIWRNDKSKNHLMITADNDEILIQEVV